MNTEIRLPEKLSGCILLALNDEEACFNSPDYTINMNYYHEPPGEIGYGYSINENCVVCFAGAVMAKTLGGDPTSELIPEDFCEYNEVRLGALDEIRGGNIDHALDEMEIDDIFDELPGVVDVTPYEDDRDKWRKDMIGIVKMLEEYDL
jgi:hypothetical protein